VSNIKTTTLTRKEFDKLVKQIADQTYCYRSLELTTDFLYHSLHADNDKLIKLLSNALKQNPYIKKISLVNQNITNEGAIALAEVETLEEINLGCNYLRPSGISAIIQNNVKILSVECNNHIFNGHTDTDILEMIKLLNQNQTLTELNLCGTKIANHYLTEIIAGNTTIKILDLSQNHSSVEGLRPIEHNKSLQYLDLSRCELIDEAAEIISKNSILVTLIIDESRITNKGGGFLSTHPTLKVLSIIDSEMTAEGLCCFLSSNLEKITPDNVKKKLITELEMCEFFREFDKRHSEDVVITHDNIVIEEVMEMGGEITLPGAE